VIITIIGVASSIFNTITGLPDDLSTIQFFASYAGMPSAVAFAIAHVFSLVETVMELLTAICIFTRNRHVITTIAATGVAAVCGIICTTIATVAGPTLSSDQTAFLAVVFSGVAIVSIAISVLMMVYFFKSVRVRTYMRSDAYITQGMWKFVKPPLPAVPDPPAQML